MQNEYAAPVDHGVLSATGSVAVGTVGGAFRSVGKAALWCVGIGAAVGLLAATGLLPTISVAASSGVWSAIGGTALGAFGGGIAAALVAPLAGLIGGGKGAMQAHQRVSEEKGAAQAMQAQVAVYQAQAMAQAAGNDNKYNFPPQGSAMNPAGTTIGSIQRDGVMAGQQLQRA